MEVDDLNGVLHPELEPITVTAPVIAHDQNMTSKAGPLSGIVGAVAATLLLTFVPTQEGVEYKAYKDIAGVWTICAGDTHDVHAGLIETPEGCLKRTELQLSIHAKGVMLCTPRLKEDGRDYQRAAGTDLAYNIGVGGYCRSTIDKKWDAGEWLNGCNGFLAWNKARVNGKLVPVNGLTLRRKREIQICGTNIVPGWTPENLQSRIKAVK
jgi:lysozyme